MLTNWNTMRARIVEMERLENLRDSGEINRLTKKEGLLIEREITRLNTRLDGVRAMKGLPDLVFIVDVGREDAAVHECNILNIPIVALVDTNCNPEGVDYVIPSNDDAIRAIKLLVGKMADAALEGRAMRKDIEPEMDMPQAAEAGATAATPVKRQVRPNVEAEVELGDDALLGKSTLAKLTPKTEVKAEPVAFVEEIEVEAEDVSEVLSQIIPEPAEPEFEEEPFEESVVTDFEEEAEPETEIEAPAAVAPPVVEVTAPAKKPAASKPDEAKKPAKKPAASKSDEAKKPAKKPAASKTTAKTKTTKK
jgi:hypothetical protein